MWTNPSLGDRGHRRRGDRRRHRVLRGQGRRPRRDEVPPARLGPFPPALLGLPDPVVHCEACGVVPEKKENLPVELPDDVSFDPRQPARPAPDLAHCTCPKCGGRAARNRHDGHLRRFVVVFRALHRAPSRHADRPGGSRLLDERRPVYRRHRARDPAPALFPLLRPRDAHHGHLPERLQEPFDALFTQGHGDARDLHHPR
jgi:leucyl-tRNA synthetase